MCTFYNDNHISKGLYITEKKNVNKNLYRKIIFSHEMEFYETKIYGHYSD